MFWCNKFKMYGWKCEAPHKFNDSDIHWEWVYSWIEWPQTDIRQSSCLFELLQNWVDVVESVHNLLSLFGTCYKGQYMICYSCHQITLGVLWYCMGGSALWSPRHQGRSPQCTCLPCKIWYISWSWLVSFVVANDALGMLFTSCQEDG